MIEPTLVYKSIFPHGDLTFCLHFMLLAQLPQLHVYGHALVHIVLIAGTILTMAGGDNWVKSWLRPTESWDNNIILKQKQYKKVATQKNKWFHSEAENFLFKETVL